MKKLIAILFIAAVLTCGFVAPAAALAPKAASPSTILMAASEKTGVPATIKDMVEAKITQKQLDVAYNADHRAMRDLLGGLLPNEGQRVCTGVYVSTGYSAPSCEQSCAAGRPCPLSWLRHWPTGPPKDKTRPPIMGGLFSN